jgi:replicative DNA helicase
MRNLKPPKEDTFKDLLGQALEQMKTGGTRGIGTGIPLLNRCTNGLQQGHFIVLGARPAVGKTALAVNLASHIRKEHKVSFFSLEMPALSIAQRILCLESNIPFSRLIRGKVDADEKRRLQDAFKILSNSGVFIHAGDSRMATIKEQIRRDVEEGAKLVIIDYLNLISGVSGRQRWEMVGEITREIKLTAMERKIPIIGLAQLGRVAEKEKPTLADLRESGSIEQDADLVGLLIRERDSEEAILDVAKNRHGAPRKINLTFNAELMVFSQEGI